MLKSFQKLNFLDFNHFTALRASVCVTPAIFSASTAFRFSAFSVSQTARRKRLTTLTKETTQDDI